MPALTALASGAGGLGIPDGANFRYFAQLETVISTVFYWEHEREKFDR